MSALVDEKEPGTGDPEKGGDASGWKCTNLERNCKLFSFILAGELSYTAIPTKIDESMKQR